MHNPSVRLVLWVLLLLAGGPAAGQRQVADSLRRQLLTTPPDTSRVLLLSSLCLKTSVQNAVQAVAYGQQGLALAQRLRHRYGTVACLNALAQAESMRQNYVGTTRYYQWAVREAAHVPRATHQLTLALMGLGQLAAEQEEFVEAASYFRLAIRRMQQQPYQAYLLDIMLVRSNLATLYLGWMQSGRPVPDSLPRLHAQYTRLALATFQQLPVAQQRSFEGRLGFCFDNMAMLHLRDQRYDSAAYCETKAVRLFWRADNKYGAIHAQQVLAEVRLAQHRWADAAQLVRPTINWARQLASTGYEAHGQQLLAAALDHTGRSHEAYELSRSGQLLLDSLNSATQRTALARLRVQFETERQREQVRTLTQRNRLQQAITQRQHQQLLWLAAVLLAVGAGLAASGSLAWRLRRSQARLRHQNAELTATRAEQDRLYALVAHDLRNPVEAFAGLADLLTRYVERQDTARLAGLGGRVRQAAQGLRTLLDNLLNWALTQRGELLPKLEEVAIAPLLAETADLYQPSAEASGLTLVIEPGGAGPLVADQHMTRTILRNLLSNALRATPAGGVIYLAATNAPEGYTTIQVRDTGEGMTAEQVHQLLSTTAPATTGRPAGLGLRLSQAFARVQQGKLMLTSQLGQGTTAELTLPRHLPAASPSPSAAGRRGRA